MQFIVQLETKNKKIINIHEAQTNVPAAKLKVRYMSFADTFVSNRKINVLELNFKRPIVTTQ
jgi:hypothetical protein